MLQVGVHPNSTSWKTDQGRGSTNDFSVSGNAHSLHKNIGMDADVKTSERSSIRIHFSVNVDMCVFVLDFNMDLSGHIGIRFYDFIDSTFV